MSLHRVRNLLEARDVRTDDQARQDFARITFLHAELSASLKGRPEYALHDPLEPAVDLVERPGEPGRVLRHLETRNGDTATVARLTGSVPDGLFDTLRTSGFEDVDRLLGAALERGIRVGLYEEDCADAPCWNPQQRFGRRQRRVPWLPPRRPRSGWHRAGRYPPP